MTHRACESGEPCVTVTRDELRSDDGLRRSRGRHRAAPRLGDARRGHAVEGVARHLPSVLAPFDGRGEREEVAPIGEQVDAIDELAAANGRVVHREEVLPAACGELQRARFESAVLRGPLGEGVVATVARVDVEDDEAASSSCGDGEVQVVAALEPLANLLGVRRCVVNAVRRRRELPVWHDGKDGPAPRCVGQGGFEPGHLRASRYAESAATTELFGSSETPSRMRAIVVTWMPVAFATTFSRRSASAVRISVSVSMARAS